MAQVVRAYDKEKGGKQTFPLVVFPDAVLAAHLLHALRHFAGWKQITWVVDSRRCHCTTSGV
jgi:hypothetical protein